MIMSLLGSLFQKKNTTFVGTRYCATGVFGYSFRKGEDEVFCITSPVLPNPDIYLNGFHQELIHRHYDGELTLIPGVRRIFVDASGELQGYYEYKSLSEYRIGAGNMTASVKTSDNGWLVFDGANHLANIERITPNNLQRYEENGYDMELRFLITISKKTDLSLYPYIMAIPMLGF